MSLLGYLFVGLIGFVGIIVVLIAMFIVNYCMLLSIKKRIIKRKIDKKLK